ncbi:MAG: hypothetical protein WC438_05045 [Candidatus Pacearchaeota archaeon]
MALKKRTGIGLAFLVMGLAGTIGQLKNANESYNEAEKLRVEKSNLSAISQDLVCQRREILKNIQDYEFDAKNHKAGAIVYCGLCILGTGLILSRNMKYEKLDDLIDYEHAA